VFITMTPLALKAVLEAGGTLDSINLNNELGNAAFFGRTHN